MNVAIDDLRSTTRRVLLRQGYDEAEAAVILDVLMYAQLRGNNQGIVKLVGAGMPKDPAVGEIEVVYETPISAVLDGHHNQGMVVLSRAVDLALEKARAGGFGAVGTRGTASSTGAIGTYAARIAHAGCVGLVFAGSSGFVAMHGSYEPLFGTNPIAIGVPNAGGEPVVLDMATSAIALYGVVEAQIAGESIPPDVAYDAQGRPTTDPAAALDGALRPFDGYKGAGLSLMVEILTGPLVGASFAGLDGPDTSWGNLVVALDPALFGDRETFARNVARLVERVKGADRLPGVDAIRVPGERGDALTRRALDAGEVEIEPNLWRALQSAAED